jgi:hypothetical protein
VNGATPLHVAAVKGHAAVTKQLLAARCIVDLQDENGFTALRVAVRLGHVGIATLIRNEKQETPRLGIRVVINGLVAKPEVNGCTGTAVSFDVDTGCYLVEVAESGTVKRFHRAWNSQDAFAAPDNSSSFMIKPCNLLKCGITTTVVKALVSDAFAAALAAVPADDWGRTWPSDRTFKAETAYYCEVEKDLLG